MSEESSETAISIEGSTDGGKLVIGSSLLSAVGKAASWLMPRKDARYRITSALAERVSRKLLNNEPLNDEDRHLVSTVFDREARLIENREAVAEELERVLPEVASITRKAPHDSGTAPGFFDRAEFVASETTTDEIRNLLARVLAGEISKAGTISTKTLEVLRSLDPVVAQSFVELRGYLLHDVLFFPADVKDLMPRGAAVHLGAFVEHGLLFPGLRLFAFKNWPSEGYTYGNRRIRAVFANQDEDPLAASTGMYLTRVGRDLASVIPKKINEPFFDALAISLAGSLGRYGKIEVSVETGPWIEISYPATD